MQRLTSVFRDVGGLHARIATYLHHSSILRIGIVPLVSRNRTAPLLMALLDDPIQKTAWATALESRPLTKDVLVTQSTHFTHVETHNSLVVYPVPFAGPPVEFIEANSLEDSWDHLKTCHLIIQVGNGETKPAQLDWPRVTVVDRDSDFHSENNVADQIQDEQFSGEIIRINSAQAITGTKLLQESPKNIDKYLDLRTKSNVDSLKFDSYSVYEALQRSIWQSCEEQIKECVVPKNEPAAEKNLQVRQQWSQSAHQELQGELLPQLRDILDYELAWYKLFARSDDVYPTLMPLLETALPQSRDKFQYLMGRLGAKGKKIPPHSEVIDQSNPAEEAAYEISTTAGAEALELNQLTSKLHNQSIKAVLSSFSIQLPIVGVAVAGWLWGGLNWYSMGALALLGVATGLKNMQNRWIQYTNRYESQVRDVFVTSIKHREQQLWSIGEEDAYQASKQQKLLKDALAEAKNSLAPQATTTASAIASSGTAAATATATATATASNSTVESS